MKRSMKWLLPSQRGQTVEMKMCFPFSSILSNNAGENEIEIVILLHATF